MAMFYLVTVTIATDLATDMKLGDDAEARAALAQAVRLHLSGCAGLMVLGTPMVECLSRVDNT